MTKNYEVVQLSNGESIVVGEAEITDNGELLIHLNEETTKLIEQHDIMGISIHGEDI